MEIAVLEAREYRKPPEDVLSPLFHGQPRGGPDPEVTRAILHDVPYVQGRKSVLAGVQGEDPVGGGGTEEPSSGGTEPKISRTVAVHASHRIRRKAREVVPVVCIGLKEVPVFYGKAVVGSYNFV